MHTYRVIEEGTSLAEARRAMILLHGRGADPYDILPLADSFCDESFYIAAPAATGNAWYPKTFLAPVDQNEPWLTSSLDTIKKLVDGIRDYIPQEEIYIMGFSQGACLSLEFAARHPGKYAGIAAFYGGLIGDKLIRNSYTGSLNGTRIFIGNSDTDPYIPLERSEESESILGQMGADVTLKVYPGMAHTITQEEIEAVRQLMF